MVGPDGTAGTNLRGIITSGAAIEELGDAPAAERQRGDRYRREVLHGCRLLPLQ